MRFLKCRRCVCVVVEKISFLKGQEVMWPRERRTREMRWKLRAGSWRGTRGKWIMSKKDTSIVAVNGGR